MLPIAPGTTLRSYLSDMLSCDPMRITKKFAGASCIGKQVFTPAADVTPVDQERWNRELNTLKDMFRKCVQILSSIHKGSFDLLCSC